MGGETGRESAGPIRRFPTGFWSSFNLWWHGEYGRLGQRPSSKAITKWHAENAAKVWGENAVSYQETQRHANRMKCRRTGQHVHRRMSLDEDEDDEESCQDVPLSDTAERGVSAKPSCNGDVAAATADQPSIRSPAKAPSASVMPNFKFDAHSDPPGALTIGYMNADSDLPAPAAPSLNLVKCFSGPQPDTKPLWMQPDPTVGPGFAPGAGQGVPYEALGLWSPCWDSAFPVMSGHAREVKAESCSALGHDWGYLTEGSWASKWRHEDSAMAAQPSLHEMSSAKSEMEEALTEAQPRPPPPQRANLFAEMAAATAAAVGLHAIHALPAARDAVALLSSAAMAAPRQPFQRCDPGSEPVWLQRTGVELNKVMLEMGLLATDADALATGPGGVGRPHGLSSTQPLRLPEPGPRRDLDSILRRGLQRDGNVHLIRSAPAASIVAPLRNAGPVLSYPSRVVGW